MSATAYRVKIRGCDDSTIFNIDLTSDEARAVKRIAEMSEERSEYRCQPTLHLERTGVDEEDE